MLILDGSSSSLLSWTSPATSPAKMSMVETWKYSKQIDWIANHTGYLNCFSSAVSVWSSNINIIHLYSHSICTYVQHADLYNPCAMLHAIWYAHMNVFQFTGITERRSFWQMGMHSMFVCVCEREVDEGQRIKSATIYDLIYFKW